jgi:hypothetical protein
MKTQYGYLVVEGPHDVEFVGRFLKLKGCKVVQYQSELDPFWHPLVPKDFPPDDDLLKRVPVPKFFTCSTHSIAIHSAMGDSNILDTTETTLAVLRWDDNRFVGVGIVLDADNEVSPQDRFEQIKTGLLEKLPPLGWNSVATFPQSPGEVTSSKPRLGIFVLPDNVSNGTLEDLLLECAQQEYPTLLDCATEFLNCVEPTMAQLDPKESREFKKPAGRQKMLVGSLANVLRPGKAVQVSLQDNRWVTAQTVTLPRLATIHQFLETLFFRDLTTF